MNLMKVITQHNILYDRREAEKKTNFNILYLEYPIISNGKIHFHQIKNKFEPN